MTDGFGPGSTFGGSDAKRFVVEALVGRGGQAEVFRCMDSRLHRKVALKVCTAPDGGNRKLYLDRFEHELRLTSRVQHPHVLQVYDCGELANGQPWVMLEWMQHGSLADLVRRERDTGYYLPLPYVHYYATSMAAALRAAHGAQIVHRDVKPDNVLVGHDGVAKLTDFGIGKDLTSEAPQLTAIGQTLGTLGFMANEQLKGLPGPQSDIFSWGVSVFSLLLGRMPKQQVVNSIPMGILEDDALDEVPETFREVLGRATALDLAERYPSFTELLSDLRAVDLTKNDTRPLFTPDSLPVLPSNAFVSGFTSGGVVPGPPEIRFDGTVPAQKPLTYDGTLGDADDQWADTAELGSVGDADANAPTASNVAATAMLGTTDDGRASEPGPTRAQRATNQTNAPPPEVAETRVWQEEPAPAPRRAAPLFAIGIAALLAVGGWFAFGRGPAPADPEAEQAAASAYARALLGGDSAGAQSAAAALPASAADRPAGQLVAGWDALAAGRGADARALVQPLLAGADPTRAEAALLTAATHRREGPQGYSAALEHYRTAAACGSCGELAAAAQRGADQACFVLGPAVPDCVETLAGINDRDRLFAAASVLRSDGRDADAGKQVLKALAIPSEAPSCFESAALASLEGIPGVAPDDLAQARRAAARTNDDCGNR